MAPRQPQPLKPPPRPERVAAFGFGISAESRAAAWLIGKAIAFWRGAGKARSAKSTLSPRAATVDVRRGESARDARRSGQSVTERQKQRIAAAAEIWLAAIPIASIRDIRFDAILVAPGRLPRHIPAAFESA